MYRNYLPIGTVVLLKEGTKKVMITGYCSKGEDDDHVYDFNGCIFPEGLMENVYCLFDKEAIEEILYVGLENEEYEEYTKKINSIIKEKNLSGSLKNTKNNSKLGEKRHGRIPKKPTAPMSKSEMLNKYGVTKLSGQSEK